MFDGLAIAANYEYNYTGASFLDGGKTYAEIIDHAERGYIRLSLDQCGCSSARLVWVLSGFWKCENIDEVIPADNSEGWETLRHSYETAARKYNSYVDSEEEYITLF